jgi:hypothetical protein
MIYNEVIDTWLNLLATASTEIDFQKLIPRAIEATELPIYRVMDFLNTIETQTTTLTAGSRNFTLPVGMIILRSINAITPASATVPDNGTRVPLLRTTNEVLDAVWGNSGTPGAPQQVALLTDTTGLVGPPPDQNYTLECIGTFRPAPLSPANPTTFLTLNVPDLYIASGMIFWSAYYQNFGAASDNPQQAVSWQSTFDRILAGVNLETLRQKAASVSWTPYQPTPTANVARERGGAPGAPS